MGARNYLIASAMLGLIAVWASENMFWIVPPADLTPFGMVYTWMAYSFCAASALSAVLLTGVRGYAAAFLGAAITGWLAEGVIVGEMYQAFPFQLVWTPLAWHALVSGLGVFALGRIVVRWPVWRQIAVWGILGLFIGFWAQFWPLERSELPGAGPLLAYLGGVGMLVPLAQIALDRVGSIPRLPLWLMLVAPACLALLWIFQTLAAPSVLRLSLPLLLGLTLWTMKRLGGVVPDGRFGQPASSPVRYFLFLTAPFVGAPLALTGWDITGGFEANVAVVLVTAPLSLLLYILLLIRAIRPKRG